MTDTDILRLAEPFLSMRDTAQPMIRGREDIVKFAHAVLRENYKSAFARLFPEFKDEQRRQQDPA